MESSELSDRQLIPALMTFCVDGISPEIIEAFAVLQASDRYRIQIIMVVEALHFGPVKASFTVIGHIFGKSKGAIYKEYEKSQRESRGHRRPSLVSESELRECVPLSWNVLRKESLQCTR
jgi:hypothetical protein